MLRAHRRAHRLLWPSLTVALLVLLFASLWARTPSPALPGAPQQLLPAAQP